MESISKLVSDSLARDGMEPRLDHIQLEPDRDPDPEVIKAVPPSISSAWGAGLMEVQNRETKEVVRRPPPLPSGF